MIMFGLSNIVKSYGFKKILNKFNLEAHKGDRIALIGPNGCGKTTVFNILTKEIGIDSGTISMAKNIRIGHLSQIPPKSEDDYFVKEILLEPFKEVYEVLDKMAYYEQKLSEVDGKELEKVLKKYGNLQDHFNEIEGYEVNKKVDCILAVFKIDKEMMERKFNSLSGGEKTIINLAALVISKPDLLLLDEPTNHLDITTLEWLEKYLSNYNGTIVISSHDRYFLDRVTNKTILIERGKEEIFHGNYSYFLEENERRIMNEFAKFKDQQKLIESMKKKIKKLQEFGRLAAPEGVPFFKRAASIQKRLDKIEVLDKPVTKIELPINFDINNRTGKIVLSVSDLNLNAGNKILLENSSFEIFYQDKIAIMGKNGCGKSTLIKELLNELKKKEHDKWKIGTNIKVGYIPQIITFDDEEATIIDTCRRFFSGNETELRRTLVKFMFMDDDIYKRVGTLSGGEKVRLKLLELIQTKANLLILDEPTNHIDIDTKEILEEALLDYEGTLLFISHDRYFINKIAKKLIMFEDKRLISFDGNYEYYKEKNTLQ